MLRRAVEMELRHIVMTMMSILIDESEGAECHVWLEGIPVVDCFDFSCIEEFEIDTCAFWSFIAIQEDSIDVDRRLSVSGAA